MRDSGPTRVYPIDLSLVGPALDVAVRTIVPDRIVISGGEPTLVPNVVELIEFVNALCIRSSLCTNATTITPSRASQLRAAGLTSATVGIEGVNADYDEYRRSNRGFERAIAGIEALVDADISVTINVTVNDRVIHTAAEVADLLKSTGVKRVCVTSPIRQGRLQAISQANGGRVTKDSFEDFVRRLRALVEGPIAVRTPRCNRDTLCPSGYSVFSMDRRGRLGPCPDVGAMNILDLPENS
jgi:MoaA/NifB/PqqE/SkfB family radical SAM enzyme